MKDKNFKVLERLEILFKIIINHIITIALLECV